MNPNTKMTIEKSEKTYASKVLREFNEVICQHFSNPQEESQLVNEEIYYTIMLQLGYIRGDHTSKLGKSLIA